MPTHEPGEGAVVVPVAAQIAAADPTRSDPQDDAVGWALGMRQPVSVGDPAPLEEEDPLHERYTRPNIRCKLPPWISALSAAGMYGHRASKYPFSSA